MGNGVGVGEVGVGLGGRAEEEETVDWGNLCNTISDLASNAVLQRIIRACKRLHAAARRPAWVGAQSPPGRGRRGVGRRRMRRPAWQDPSWQHQTSTRHPLCCTPLGSVLQCRPLAFSPHYRTTNLLRAWLHACQLLPPVDAPALSAASLARTARLISRQVCQSLLRQLSWVEATTVRALQPTALLRGRRVGGFLLLPLPSRQEMLAPDTVAMGVPQAAATGGMGVAVWVRVHVAVAVGMGVPAQLVGVRHFLDADDVVQDGPLVKVGQGCREGKTRVEKGGSNLWRAGHRHACRRRLKQPTPPAPGPPKHPTPTHPPTHIHTCILLWSGVPTWLPRGAEQEARDLEDVVLRARLLRHLGSPGLQGSTPWAGNKPWA